VPLLGRRGELRGWAGGGQLVQLGGQLARWASAVCWAARAWWDELASA